MDHVLDHAVGLSSLCRNALQVFIRDDDTLEAFEQFCGEPLLLLLAFSPSSLQILPNLPGTIAADVQLNGVVGALPAAATHYACPQ